MFFALISLVLVCSIAMIINVGQAINSKIAAQNAADAAAAAATLWMARGSNLLQQFNGLHWDVDAFAASLLYISIDVASAILDALDPCVVFFCSCCPEWYEVWNIEDKFIAGVSKVRKIICKLISGVQKVINKCFPYLAAYHANGMARDNGADRLFENSLDFLKNIFKVKVPSSIKKFLGKEPIYTWTLYPSIWPPSSTKFAEEEEAEDHSTPFYCTPFNPFALHFPYWINREEDLRWEESYYESKNVDKPITFIVSRNARLSYMLGTLLLGKEKSIPSVLAISAAKITGDELTPAGTEDYWCYQFGVGMACKPGCPVPGRIFEGKGYKSNFDSEYAPVKFIFKDGEDVLVLH